MPVPFKKRRIVLPQHMEVTPEPAISSVTVDVAKSEVPSQHSISLSSKYSAQAALVDNKLDHVRAMIKIQEILIARTSMQVFETCNSQEEAEQAIRTIRDLFRREAQDEERIETLSHTYMQLNAVPEILKAMNQWQESLKFISLATDVLKVLLFHSPKARNSFLRLGGVSIIMKACQEHWYLPLTKAALGALGNMAPFLTHENVVIEDCLGFVVKCIRVFDGDAECQRLGTYFCLTLAASTAMRQRRNFQPSNCNPEAVPSSSGVLKRKLEA